MHQEPTSRMRERTSGRYYESGTGVRNGLRGSAYPRKSRVRQAGIAGVCMLTALILAACGGGSKSSEPGVEAGQSPAENKGPVKLVFYSTAGWTQEAFNERFGDAMRRKFPDYEITYIQSGKDMQLPDLMAAGQQIDVFWQAVDVTIQQMQEYKLEYDMSPLIQKHGLDLSKLEQSSIDAARSLSGGKMYALPLVINTAALYYNKDLFDKMGVPYPKDGMNWDQVLELAKRMKRTDGGLEYFGLGTSVNHNFSLNPLSLPYVDAKTEKATVLSEPKWKTVYEVMVEAYKLNDGTVKGPTHFVKDKNVAMTEGLANLFLNQDMSDMNWDLVSYPVYKDAPARAPQPYPTLFGVTSTSKFKDEAFRVLQHMLSEQEQLSLSERAIIPVLQQDSVMKAFGTKSKYPGKNYNAILGRKFSPLPTKTKYDSKSQGIYNKYVTPVAKGEMDLNTALRMIDEEMAAMIAAEKAR